MVDNRAMQTDALLTIQEAAELLRVKRSTLYTWVHRHQIPSQKVGKLVRFHRGDLEGWLKAQHRPVKWGTFGDE
jgi:excisionase family DNA binding protein